jgi:hypothetical protein
LSSYFEKAIWIRQKDLAGKKPSQNKSHFLKFFRGTNERHEALKGKKDEGYGRSWKDLSSLARLVNKERQLISTVILEQIF